MSKLWYKKEAQIWEEALPLGNGRLGAMVYGRPIDEIIQVNEESMWYGAFVDRNNGDAFKCLPKIRNYIFSGEINKAEELMKYSLTGTPDSMHPYQSLGDIFIHFHNINEVTDYYRELDISKAVYKQSFKDEDTIYTKDIFISKVADAMIIRLTANGEKTLNFDAILRREKFFDYVGKSDESSISLCGNLGKGGFDFSMTLSAKAIDGEAKVIGENLIVRNATKVYLYFTANTTYSINNGSMELVSKAVNMDTEKSYKLLKEANNKVIKELKNKSYSELFREHMDDYQNLYDRVDFSIEDIEKYDVIPTDERILNAATKKGADLGLNKLYFDYGRYLLISCSREDGLPATLQGIWNKDMTPAWDSKYTININTQMNYWPAEVCNLSECHTPLFNLIKRMVKNGEQTAQKMYNCRGFVAHHNTDIYGDTAPQDIWNPGTYWVMGAAWLCTHLWTHYEYTQDLEFLKEFFPIMEKAALFFVDFLVEHDGYMVTCPSVSPENTFILENGQRGANIYGVTMDNQILRDLFTQCIKAADILNIKDEVIDNINKLNDKLIPTQISKDGTILEWPLDYEEAEIGHRHISHLYGLYPSNQITVDGTPLLAKAAKATLERRLSGGGGHTGWSRAWIINHYAKLWDGEEAFNNIQKLFANSTYLNLFDKHPPFQIDGNFGATAAIANMLVQSDEDRIVLLPALPSRFKSGSIKGLKLRGNGVIDIYWSKGKLTNCKITFKKDYVTNIKYLGQIITVSFKTNETINLRRNRLGKLIIEG